MRTRVIRKTLHSRTAHTGTDNGRNNRDEKIDWLSATCFYTQALGWQGCTEFIVSEPFYLIAEDVG